MVVGTICIFGDFEPVRIANTLFWIVVVKYGDDAFGAFHQKSRVVALLLVAGQVAHLAFAVALKPLLDVGRLFFQSRRLGNAAGVEAHAFGLGYNPPRIHQNGAKVKPTDSG